LEEHAAIKKFLELTGTEFPGESFFEKLITLWNCHGIQNRIRTFLFRFFNSTLGINTRLSHFVQGHSRGCVFCVVKGTIPPPDESFKHIFLDCPVVHNWHDNFISTYLPPNYIRGKQDRIDLFFLGRVHEPLSDNFFVTICCFIFQYTIWDARLRKKIPSFTSLNLLFKEIISSLLRTNSLARKSKTKANYFMFRNLGDGDGPEGPEPGQGPE
jgi:hypothetical protein